MTPAMNRDAMSAMGEGTPDRAAQDDWKSSGSR